MTARSMDIMYLFLDVQQRVDMNDLFTTQEGNDMKIYRVYGKPTGQKRFKPFDITGARLVDNLIYASFCYEDQHEDLKNWVAKQNNKQNEIELEIRCQLA